MLFSVITVALNAKGTIEDTIKSVLNQTYRDVEYIVIDGGSEDGTLEVIRKYKQKISRIVSERDNGLYDAFNKGIRLARGDVIGLLNGDDLYANKNVLKKVSEIFKKHHTDSAYGDLVYVDRHDINKITRYWKAGECSPTSFKRGWMAPHPTFFVKKGAYKKYGSFRTDFSFQN